jgi:hypothetical protein
VFSVSINRIEAARAYIRKQKEHHKKMSFRAELQWFLDTHGLEYDPRFLPPGEDRQGPMPPPSAAPDESAI